MAIDDLNLSFSFSKTIEYLLQEDCGVLPLSFLSFTAEKKDEWILLNWITTNMPKTKYFEVLYSYTSSIWFSSTVISGAYTSNQYMFPIDSKNQKIYFKIKQYYFDGSSIFSNVISLNLTENANELLTIFPNPTNGLYKVHIPVIDLPEVIEYSVHDINDFAVMYGFSTNSELCNNQISVNISHLITGLYWFKIKLLDEIQVIKVFKY